MGEYQGLAGLRRGFAAAFTLPAPQAKDGPTDIFFAQDQAGLIACLLPWRCSGRQCSMRGSRNRGSSLGSPNPRLSGIVGSFEEQGWKLAGAIVPIAYIAWSLWLILAGLVLLLG